MIHLKTDARLLSILLPNNNKALAEALKEATPAQLQQLSQGKDIGSILSSLMNESIGNAKSDRIILEILKNSPLFKEMGNFTEGLQKLLAVVKEEKPLLTLYEKLNESLRPVESAPRQNVHKQLNDSGVFMESKMAAALQPELPLKAALEQLKNVLQRSESPAARAVEKAVTVLLGDAAFAAEETAEAKTPAQLAVAVKKITEPLQLALGKGDVLFTKEAAQLVENLQRFVQNNPPMPEAIAAKTVNAQLETLQNALKQNSFGDLKPLVTLVDELKSILTPQKELPQNPKLPQELKGFIERFESTAKSSDVLLSKEINAALKAVTEFAKPDRQTPEALMQRELKTAVVSLHELLQKSTHPQSNGIIRALEKIITTLNAKVPEPATAPQQPVPLSPKQQNALQNALQPLLKDTNTPTAKALTPIMQQLAKSDAAAQKLQPQLLGELQRILSQSGDARALAPLKTAQELFAAIQSRPMPALEQLIDAKSAQSLKEVTVQLQSALDHSDPIFGEESAKAIKKVALFANPDRLDPEKVMKQSVAHDVKSLLMQLHDEVKNNNIPKASDLLQQIDKLTAQIDYHQLLSHLSNASSIYVPFVWEQLDEGRLAFKRGKEKKFYCEINLKLKEYGELNLMLALYDETQIEIQAHTEKPTLKEAIEANLQMLRTMLIEAGFTPRRIRVFEMSGQKRVPPSYGGDEGGLDMGFEVKV